MYKETIEKISKSSIEKSLMFENHKSKYLISSMMAGVLIGIGVIISFTIGGLMSSVNNPSAKIFGGLSFSVALVMVIFTGTELFTGNNMSMAIGRMSNKVSSLQMIKIWGASWLGNLMGAILLAVLYVGSGLVDRGTTMDYFSVVAHAKVTISPFQIFLRAILCNFLVCLAIFITNRVKDDSAKILVICLIIVTFFTSGFEHSVANMTVYSIALISSTIKGVTFINALIALIMATLGNIVGGGLFVGAAFQRLSTIEK
ncbi:formate/nitrite transporter family protein [Peptostreptococcus equinus]|uniref:Formate/nitrite transporter family protein n=1 Tax=Peptostreptococcus equinus TaxID=3003601 RepID=A0ABY7JT04_9FIRM|nr:formate/nitrite transporter family protein [Peptostreptococcus sp. CBA3647]WAW15105.1 formate/nitrite transporter family protein [Peptostreptococcus sp. CBA3647]